MSEGRNITIQFASEKAAKQFALWLCKSGEQQYWKWMESREQEEPDGDITALQFRYYGQEDKRYGEFMCDWTIGTTLGRLDKDE